jgi:hypothetical protein
VTKEPAYPVAAELLIRRLTATGPRAPVDVSVTPEDWRTAVEIAFHHGLAPIFFRSLKAGGGRAGVPADAWDRLRIAYFTAADRSLHLYRELRVVLESLRGLGIPVIVLKGAHLAETVYGDVALRPMYDADLMVRKADLSRTQEVLLGMGWYQHLSEDIEERCKWSDHLGIFYRRGSAIEVHWNIEVPVSPFKLDGNGFWKRAQPVVCAGVEVLALSPEDTLLQLSLHATYHHCLEHGLRPLHDVAEVVRHYGPTLDWSLVVSRATGCGAEKCVGLTLRLSKSMLGAAVPEDVMEQLVPGGIDQGLLETARRAVLGQVSFGRWTPQPLFTMWGAKSIGDRAKLFWNRVFLPRDEMAIKYPESEGAKHLHFYHLLRLRDIMRTYWRMTLLPSVALAWRRAARHRGAGPDSVEGPDAEAQRDRDIQLGDWLKSREPEKDDE